MVGTGLSRDIVLTICTWPVGSKGITRIRTDGTARNSFMKLDKAGIMTALVPYARSLGLRNGHYHTAKVLHTWPPERSIRQSRW